MNEVKESRLRMKLTQSQLAKRLGVTVSTISNWECERRQPNKAFLMLIKAIEDNNKTENLT